MQAQSASLYEKYSKVLGVFDSEQAAGLTEEECVVLIKIMEFKNRLKDMEMKSVYFCGCYYSVDYLKKAEIL